VSALARSLSAALVAALALLLVGALLGRSPSGLLAIFVDGSIGSSYAVAETLLKSVPLLLTGLSVVVAFRAGVWNIGAEGQFIAGGIAAFLAAAHLPAGPVATGGALVAACAGGALWGATASLLRRWRNAPEVLTTILLNFIAVELLGYAVNGPLRESAGRYPQTDALPAATWLIPAGNTRIHSGALVAVVVAIALHALLHRTVFGLRLRATGYNPSATRFAGVDVDRVTMRAMMLSAAIAGLAGGIELLGVTHRLFELFASGYGYSGIAVALLGQLEPLATIGSALFFGMLATGTGELQRAADISAALGMLAEAIVILMVIMLTTSRFGPTRRSRATS
jgi:ABC-type uncharacterized transport system permease subunit